MAQLADVRAPKCGVDVTVATPQGYGRIPEVTRRAMNDARRRERSSSDARDGRAGWRR